MFMIHHHTKFHTVNTTGCMLLLSKHNKYRVIGRDVISFQSTEKERTPAI